MDQGFTRGFRMNAYTVAWVANSTADRRRLTTKTKRVALSAERREKEIGIRGKEESNCIGTGKDESELRRNGEKQNCRTSDPQSCRKDDLLHPIA
jgi:hypothetical protein